ncbi:MAG: hypothetical protein ACPGC9_01930 [Cytophagales bacterium]
MTKAQIEKLALTVVGTYIQKYVPPHPQGLFMSIAKVKISPDLTMLNIYFDLIATTPLDLESTLQALFVAHGWRLKKYMATHLRHRLRRVPTTLQFCLQKDPFEMGIL